MLMCFEPLGSWRHVKVTDWRTAQDFAYCMKDLVDVHFPKATVVSVVVDNLNTHTPAALYSTFAPAEACRILRQLEFPYASKHGSWLNMADIEWAVLSSQCLDRRLSDPATVRHTSATWETDRNAATATVNWQFTTAKASRKLKQLYPL